MAKSKRRRNSSGGPSLNPTGMMNANPSLRKHNFLDPNLALKEVPHPAERWASVELDDLMIRDRNGLQT